MYLCSCYNSKGNDSGLDEEERPRIETVTPAHIFSFPHAAPDGVNILELPDGSIYTGNVKNGRKHGRGVMKFVTGDVYDGQFEEDLYCGLGTLMLKDSTRYEGAFLDGFYDGKGPFETVHELSVVITRPFKCRTWKALLYRWGYLRR